MITIETSCFLIKKKEEKKISLKGRYALCKWRWRGIVVHALHSLYYLWQDVHPHYFVTLCPGVLGYPVIAGGIIIIILKGPREVKEKQL